MEVRGQSLVNMLLVLSFLGCSEHAGPQALHPTPDEQSAAASGQARATVDLVKPNGLARESQSRTSLSQPISAAEVKLDVRALAFWRNPELDKRTEFVVIPISVPGLSPHSKFQVFRTRSGLPHEEKEERGTLVYADGQLIPLSNGLYCFQIRSVTGYGEELYYSHSSGSGILRSHVGRISLNEGQVEITESEAFTEGYLYVRTIDNRVAVELARHATLNDWSDATSFGWVEYRKESLFIIDDKGNELPGWR